MMRGIRLGNPEFDYGSHLARIEEFARPIAIRAHQVILDLELMCRLRVQSAQDMTGFFGRKELYGFYAKFHYIICKVGHAFIPTFKLLEFRFGNDPGPGGGDGGTGGGNGGGSGGGSDGEGFIVIINDQERLIPLPTGPVQHSTPSKFMNVKSSVGLNATCDWLTGKSRARISMALLCGSILAGIPAASSLFTSARHSAAEHLAPAQAPVVSSKAAISAIRSITVNGSQRIEADTVRSYIQLRAGDVYTQVAADQALRDLFETELFANVAIRNNDGAVVIDVKENPVINRVILEGNELIKDDKILPEIRLLPHQIFTRTKVRADVARIIELYKRQGRFATTVEPKMVQQDQNRVDVVFEITEGPKSEARQINVLGNEKFSDGELRGEMLTEQSRFYRFFSAGDNHDPDKLAVNQQKLRQFYLTQGYADFRVISAVAELTPDKRDFIVNYVIKEAECCKWGDASVESQTRNFSDEGMKAQLKMKTGDWHNARQVADTMESLSENAGLFRHARADVRPKFSRKGETPTMNIAFELAKPAHVRVEVIDINRNTLTQDRLSRREFRLNGGGALSRFLLNPSDNRTNSQGYFQGRFENEQKQGTAPNRIILEASVEEKATGELRLSAGFSSIENFVPQASIRQRNFRGKDQTVGARIDYPRFSQGTDVNFNELFKFEKNLTFGADMFRHVLNGFNFVSNSRNATYEQLTTSASFRPGVILSFEDRATAAQGISDVRLTDRNFVGQPQIRDLDSRSVDPHVIRFGFTSEIVDRQVGNTLVTDRQNPTDDALGGRSYYLGRAELEIPLDSSARELGLRPSVFVDAGGVFGGVQPPMQTLQSREKASALQYLDASPNEATSPAIIITTNPTNAADEFRTGGVAFTEQFFDDSPRPRVSAGFGVNWNSPSGPFRSEIADALTGLADVSRPLLLDDLRSNFSRKAC